MRFFSDNNPMKFETNYRENTVKKNKWRLNNMSLNNQ